MSEGAEDARAPRSVAIEVPPAPVSIAIVRAMVRRTVAFRDDDAASTFLVALTEILGNAIDEHDRIGSFAPVVVTIESAERDVVHVRDAGAGLAASAGVEAADGADACDERGRGILLARAFVPMMELLSGPGGTRATLPLDGLGVVR